MKSPSPPSPYETAAAQTGANTDSAIATGLFNNMNETNPYGAVTYKPGTTRSSENSAGAPRWKLLSNTDPSRPLTPW